MEPILPFSFSNLPIDVLQLILSHLDEQQLSTLACISKKFRDLCLHDQNLWFHKCQRRWGAVTEISKWGGGKISCKHLFHFLDKYEKLIALWFNDDHGLTATSPLSRSSVFVFEWREFYIMGSRIFASRNGGYGVERKPFLWITATSNGEPLNYLDTGGTVSVEEKDLLSQNSGKLQSGLILVDVDPGDGYFNVRESRPSFGYRKRVSSSINIGIEFKNVYESPPDELVSEICRTLEKKPIFSGNKTERRKEKRRRMEMQRTVMRYMPNCYGRIRDASNSLLKDLSRNNFDSKLCYEIRDGISCLQIGSKSILISSSSNIFD